MAPITLTAVLAITAAYVLVNEGKARLQRAGALLGGSELAPIDQTDLAARSTQHAVRSLPARN